MTALRRFAQALHNQLNNTALRPALASLLVFFSLSAIAPIAHAALTATIQGSSDGGATWSNNAITVAPGASVQFRTNFTTRNANDCPALGFGGGRYYAYIEERDSFSSSGPTTTTFTPNQPQIYNYFQGDSAPCTNGGPSPNSPSSTFRTPGSYTITYNFETCDAYYYGYGCYGWSTAATATFTVHVGTVTLKANGQTGSINVSPGDPITLTVNASSCQTHQRWRDIWTDSNNIGVPNTGTTYTGPSSPCERSPSQPTFSAPTTPGSYQVTYESDYCDNFHNGACRGNPGWQIFGTSSVTIHVIAPATPWAAFHMDAGSWDGTTGEVVDFSGNGHNGTAENGTQTSGANPHAIAGNPGTCRYGVFNGTNNYIQVNDLSSVLDGTASLAFWIKTTQTGTAEDWSSPGIAGYEDTGKTDDIFWGWINNQGHIGMSTGNEYNNVSSVPINDGHWHYIVLTRNAATGAYQIFIDGSLNASGTTAAGTIPQTFSSIGRIENEPNSTGTPTSGHFKGELDEVQVFASVLTLSQVKTLENQTHPCTGNVTLNVSANANASTCAPDPVTITAYNSDGTIDTSYTGVVSLGSSSGHGNWSEIPGNSYPGAFAAGPADSGTAQYQFVVGDGGQIALNFADIHADDLTLSAVDQNNVSGTSALISFRNDAFVFSPQNPLGNDPNCPGGPLCGDVLAAGRPQQFQITAVRRDRSTNNECAVLTNYDGNFPLKAWITRTANDPGGAAPTINGTTLGNTQPAGNNVSLTFNSGKASLTLDTSDVGQYSLNLSDVSSGFAQGQNGNARPITGGSNILTVRPFAFAFSRVGAGGTSNPGATTPTGAVFTGAGRNFAATVTGVLWQSGDPTNGVPAGPVKASTHPPTPSFAATATVSASTPSAPATSIGGTLGAISGGSISKSAFSGGSATNSTLGYSEVGSVTLRGTSNDYLGVSGVTITGTSSPVGRFTPDHFATTTNSPDFRTFCPPASTGSGFTYMGQPFDYATPPQINVTAENVGNTITSNYYDFSARGGGNWFRLNASSLAAAAPHDRYVDANGHLLDTAALSVNGANPTVTITGHGTGTVDFTAGAGIDYVRSAQTAVAPFAADISLRQSVTDADGIHGRTDPVIFNGTGNGIAWSKGNMIRYGRLALENAYGSELLALRVPMVTQYYAGTDTGFVTNVADHCTVGLKQPITLSNYTGNLSSGETSATFTQAPTAGSFGLALSAPGAGNTGSVTLTPAPATAGGLSWLEYDWTGANPSTGSFPSDLAVFGIYERGAHTVFTHRVGGGT